MSASDRERWDARHAAVGAGTPMPPDGLRGRLDLLPGGSEAADRTGLPAGGRALDVACGRGAVAVWLAGRGFAVDAADVSRTGLASAKALAAAEGVQNVRFLEADLDAGLPVAGPYDLVVCQRYRDPALYPALAAALAPGGLLVLTVLSEVGDSGGRFRAAPGELTRAFPQLETVHHQEGDGEATLLARRS
jgi:SAM-dependent methyltransferase